MDEITKILLQILIVGVLIAIFVITYVMNKRTKKPEGCEEVNCEGCQIVSCGNYKGKTED